MLLGPLALESEPEPAADCTKLPASAACGIVKLHASACLEAAVVQVLKFALNLQCEDGIFKQRCKLWSRSDRSGHPPARRWLASCTTAEREADQRAVPLVSPVSLLAAYSLFTAAFH
jgi:hypothetical protein